MADARGVPDDITTLAHTNDRWMEAKEKPSVKEVTDHANRMLREAISSAPGRRAAKDTCGNRPGRVLRRTVEVE